MATVRYTVAMETQCPECDKPFTPVRTNQIWCSPVCRAKARVRKKRERYATPEGRAAMRKTSRESYARQKAADPEGHRHRRKAEKHKDLTTEEWDGMMAAQNGRCAICRLEFTERRPAKIDHDHDCCPGRRSCAACRRGLLCNPCNHGTGLLGDDPARLRAAADYLDRTKHAGRQRSE